MGRRASLRSVLGSCGLKGLSMRRFLMRVACTASGAAAAVGFVAGANGAAAAAPLDVAFVPTSLRSAAEQNPAAVFEVIVQGSGSAGAAAAVRSEVAVDHANAVGLKRQFATVSG